DVSKVPALPLLPDIVTYIQDQQNRFREHWINGFRNVIAGIEQKLNETHWYNHTWVERQASTVLKRFDEAFDRWRILYLNARSMIEKARAVMDDPTIRNDSEAGREAKRQHNIGLEQISLLKNEKQQHFGN